MNILRHFHISFFLIGAAFSISRLATDISLAFEYWRHSTINETEKYPSQGDQILRSHLHLNLDQFRALAFLTITWIISGGICQFSFVIHFLCRQDPFLTSLPPFVKALLVLLTPASLGPVVVYFYSAYFALCRSNSDPNQKKDVNR